MLIAGPTASGKSAVALELAHRLGGEIINADSMQLYSDVQVLTARPTVEEMAGIPHHLYGVARVTELYSVARWVGGAEAVMTDVLARGNMPIFVGGTGLYFRALLEGLSEVPEIDPGVRNAVRELVDREGALTAYAALQEEDPAMAARLNPADRQRVSRALEVIRSTGQSLALWQGRTTPGPLALADSDGQLGKVVLMPPRDWLYERCNRRFDLMMHQGALDEVRALPPADENLPGLKALGVLPLRDYLAGDCTLEDAIERAKATTRQYAKRQMTWFRNQCADWPQIDEKESESIINIIFSKIIPDCLTP